MGTRPTEVQRKVLAWLVEQGGKGLLSSGHKTLKIGKTKAGIPAVGCSVVVIDGLRAHDWIRKFSPNSSGITITYCITEKGKVAATGARA